MGTTTPLSSKEDSKPLVYISGPMTGIQDNNYPRFMQIEDKLLKAGYRVANPARNPTPDPATWENYMRLALRQLSHCDEIIMLEGWHASRGARFELDVAQALKMKVSFVDSCATGRKAG